MSVLEVKGLSHTYGGNTPFFNDAVSDVSFTVEQGEMIGIIGHPGSGKSTLVQHLNGILKPTSGEIFIDGKDIWEKPKEIRKIRSKVGLVFQYPEYQLFEETVYKDIAYGPANLGKTSEEIALIIDEVLPLVGLDADVLQKSPFELSGGQKRRVAIAGVLAMQPKVLVLDEPTAGLDPAGRNEILSCIKNLHDKKGTTVILVSHSMEDVANTVDKILVVSDAELLAYDTVTNVFKDSVALKNIGLNVPQVTRVVNHLKSKGIDLGDGICTVDAAVDAVMRYMKEGGKC